MDVLLPSGPGSRWDYELLYSLRSLEQYAKVDRLFVAGYKLWWMRDVVHVPIGELGGAANRSTNNKLQHVATETDISERFLYWADDFFLLRPFEDRVYYQPKSPGRDRMFGDAYKNALALVGKGAKDFELHLPVVLERAKVRDVVGSFTNKNTAFRTVYFNRFPRDCEPGGDVKLKGWKVPGDWPAFSIPDETAARTDFREWVAKRYPRPSRWEWPLP